MQKQKETLIRYPFENIDITPTLNQICPPSGSMECSRKRASPSSCGVACQGLYADVTKRQHLASFTTHLNLKFKVPIYLLYL